MAKEYSVYFNSRKIVLTSDYKNYFLSANGLFVSHQTPDEFTKLLVFFQSSTNVENLYIVGEDVDEMFDVLLTHFELVDAAGGLVRNSDFDVLLIKRNGFWDLPKGKAETGETPDQTAIREVSEECGLSTLKIEKPLRKTYHTYEQEGQKILKVTHWFGMLYSGQEKLTPQEQESITEAIWVKPEELSSFLSNTYESIKDVFLSAGLA